MTITWEELVSTALLGTERRPLSDSRVVNEPSNRDPLAEVLDQLRSLKQNPPEEVLSLAVAMASVRQAGRMPSRLATSTIAPGDAPPGSAPPGGAASETPVSSQPETTTDGPEQHPLVNHSASQLLDLLLTGTVAVARLNDTLIGRWLDGCATSGQRIPHRLIVALLDRATKNASLRHSASSVIGERGRYVAAHNREWNWVHASEAAATSSLDAGEISAERLTNADPLGRASLLQTWRGRDPLAAREALLGNWSSEIAADRREFVLALSTGLGPGDESFLESCLDDRGKTVREAAQTVLANLPTSAFVQRMVTRLDPLVNSKRFPRFSIEVELPEVLTDDAAKRDGLSTVDTKARAALLQQLVSAAPISWWSTKTGRPLGDVIDAVRKIDTVNEVVAGICASCARQSSAGQEFSSEELAGIRDLWMHEMTEIDSGYRTNTYNSAAGQRVAMLAPALVSQRNELISLALGQSWSARGLGDALGRLIGETPVPRAEADKLLRWANRHQSELPVLIDYSIELLVASLSPSSANDLLRLVPGDSSAHQRLRHLQAAGSFFDAISKEFP
jgi:hypothetical protein